MGCNELKIFFALFMFFGTWQSLLSQPYKNFSDSGDYSLKAYTLKNILNVESEGQADSGFNFIHNTNELYSLNHFEGFQSLSKENLLVLTHIDLNNSTRGPPVNI